MYLVHFSRWMGVSFLAPSSFLNALDAAVTLLRRIRVLGQSLTAHAATAYDKNNTEHEATLAKVGAM
jgi:hypothetical protein